MTTTNDIWIGGFKFEWDKFENLHGLCESRNDLSRFNRVAERFGVYIFTNGTRPLYIGMSGLTVDQSSGLKDRIGQYFEETKNSGVSFPGTWMKKGKCRSYKDFRRFIAGCQLITLSTEKVGAQQRGILVGETGIIGDLEKFLIHKFSPPYNNTPAYRLTDAEEKNISAAVNEKFST